MNNERVIPIDAGWQALRALAAELEAAHSAPSTKCFFEEHGDVIGRVLALLTAGGPAPADVGELADSGVDQVAHPLVGSIGTIIHGCRLPEFRH